MVALDNQNPEQIPLPSRIPKDHHLERKQPLKSHLDLENKTCRLGRFCSEPGRCARDKGELMNPERTKHTNNKKKLHAAVEGSWMLSTVFSH